MAHMLRNMQIECAPALRQKLFQALDTDGNGWAIRMYY
jgi:hypothetical protein